ncbi:hypothetical protein CHS0354_016815 [Potamilus streckersoni]|uniref:Uncharacterized protein n=1 Tax=Potamilus streckersoni TaxID=2493646 RepID=A0AAE0W7F3_9BIVA|nr:hypothetical protein CHS0354_016815 [Potamilus streckersoni]
MPSKHVINLVVDNLPGGQNAYRIRKWSTKLCGCCEDCTSCFLAMFFPPCFSCYLASRMGELCCLPICVPGSLMALRVKLRAGNNIEVCLAADPHFIIFFEGWGGDGGRD